jgi:hypothetical protein
MESDRRGSEEVGASDLTIPRIEICQALSKCRKKSDANYIAGIEEGDMYNSVTREIYGALVVVIPVYYRKEWLLWRDQDLGGGFAGAHPTPELAEAARRQQDKPEEWEAIDTAQQFVLIIREYGKLEEAVLAMAKSKGRVSRDWNSLIRMAGGPRFSRRYRVEGVEAQNTAGQDYFNVRVAAAGFVDEDQFRAAEKAYGMVNSGLAVVDYTDAADDEVIDGDSEM